MKARKNGNVARWEIRQYADVVAKLIQTLFPRTFGAWAKTFQEVK